MSKRLEEVRNLAEGLVEIQVDHMKINFIKRRGRNEKYISRFK